MQRLRRDLDLIDVILNDCDVLARRLGRFTMDVERFCNDDSDEGQLAYDAIMSPCIA